MRFSWTFKSYLSLIYFIFFFFIFFLLPLRSDAQLNPDLIENPYISCYYDANYLENENDSPSCNAFFTVAPAKPKKRCFRGKFSELKPIPANICFDRKVYRPEIVAIFSANAQYKRGFEACFCTDGRCHENGRCLHKCWANIIEKKHICEKRNCSVLSGSCKKKCEADEVDEEGNKFSERVDVDCECDPGFYMPRYTNECRDINECLISNCMRCINTIGNATCYCPDGETPKRTKNGGFLCLKSAEESTWGCDKFECTTGHCFWDHKNVSRCMCKDGIPGLPDGSCPRKISCSQFPYCQRCRIVNEYFLDCQCFVGFSWVPDKNQCMDLNECEILDKLCFKCENLIGNYYCFCPLNCDRNTYCKERNNTKNCKLEYEDYFNNTCKMCKRSPRYHAIESNSDNKLFLDTSKKKIRLNVDGYGFRGENATHDVDIEWKLSANLSVRSSKQGVFDVNDFQNDQRIEASVDGFKRPLKHQVRMRDFSVDVVFNNSFFTQIDFEPTPREVTLNVIINNKDAFTRKHLLIIEWFCTRDGLLDEASYHNRSECLRNQEVKLQTSAESFTIDTNDLLYEESHSLFLYHFHVIVTYGIAIGKAKTVLWMKRDDPKPQLVCKNNCEENVDKNQDLALMINCLDCGKMVFKWYFEQPESKIISRTNQLFLPPSELVKYDDAKYTLVVKIFFRKYARSMEILRSVTFFSSQANCVMHPPEGFAFETIFELHCDFSGRIVFKVFSNYCRLDHPIAGYLRYQGYLLQSVPNLVFGPGDVNDDYKLCIYVFNQHVKHTFVEFIVQSRYKYVPNFQFLSRATGSQLGSLNQIGNAIEYFNCDESTDLLDYSLKGEHREIIMGFVLSKWEIYDDLLLRNEIVKMIKQLFIIPFEFNPFKAIKMFDFVKLMNIYQGWNSNASSLTREEVKYGHRALLTFLSALLYSGYVTANLNEYKIKELIDYVMNNLNYHGIEYAKYFKPFEPILEETVVFTYGLMKVNLKPNQMNFNFDLQSNHKYTVDIPASVFYNSNMTEDQEVVLKMVVFPYNPFFLPNETFFVPTVSISFRTDKEFLHLSNFKDPVKITIPSWAGGRWLEYQTLKTLSNQTTFIEIPYSFYDNTLYKVRFHVVLTMLNEETHRVSGLLSVALCNSTTKELEIRNFNGKTMELCYELYLKNIAFYINKTLDFKLTLPLLLVTKTSMIILQFRSPFNVSSEFQIKIMQLSCQYWYDSEDLKKPHFTSSYGCAVSPENTNDDQLVCLCYHLSTFSEAIEHVQNKLKFSTLFVDQNKSFYLGVTIMTFIWFFFLSLSVYAFITDFNNCILTYPVDLEDNYPSSVVAYMVLVETGRRPYSSCEGTAFIQLFGTLGKSLAHKLKCSYFKTLQKGQQNIFIIRTNQLLGQITSIRVWLNKNPEKGDSKWYLSEIRVYDLQNMSTYIFLCSEWLATNSKTILNDVTFLAASSVTLNDFKYYFTYNFRKNFHNDHMWFSIFTCSTLSRYSRLQRTHVCLLNSQIFLLTTLIFDYIELIDNRNANVFYSGLMEVTLALVCGFLLIPVFSLFIMMFGDSKQDLKHHIISDWKRNTSQFLSKKRGVMEDYEENIGKDVFSIFGVVKNIFKRWKDKPVFRYLNLIEHERIKKLYLRKFPKTERDLQENDPYDNLVNKDAFKSKKKLRKNKAAQNSNMLSSTSDVKIEVRDSDDEEGDAVVEILPQEGLENVNQNNKNTQIFVEFRKSREQSMYKPIEIMGSASRLQLISELLEQGIEKSTRYKHKKVKKPDYGGSLPYWVKHLSWALLTTANLIATYCIILLISWETKLINLSWFLRVFGIFCANIFILDPLVIIFFSFIASLLSKTTSYFSYSKLCIIKTEALANLKNNLEFHYTRVNNIRSDPQYFFRHWKQKYKSSKQIQMIRRFISKILISFYLALCSLTISLTVSDRDSFQANYAIRNVLFGPEFFEIKNREMLYEWMRTKFIEELYDPHKPEFVTNAMQFSRVSKFEYLKNLDAHAISYPCVTRIPNLGVRHTKEWDNFLFGPELMIHQSYCFSYNKNVALAFVEESEKRDFLNSRHIGEGFTFYLLLSNIKSLAWVFVTITQDFGGGITTNLEKVVLMAEKPIPYNEVTVILGISMFVPAFAFFIFNNMKHLFYDGAGHFFSSIANILNMIISFMVLILVIIIVVVLPGMESAIVEFYHDTGSLETQFYNSGVIGVYFLLFTVTFLSMIKLIELLRLNKTYNRFVTTGITSSLIIFATIIKLLPVFFGVSLLINSKRKNPLYSRMYDICYTRNLLTHSGADYLKVFGGLAHLFIVALLAVYNASALICNFTTVKYFKTKGENLDLMKEIIKQLFSKDQALARKKSSFDIELAALFEEIKSKMKKKPILVLKKKK